MLPKTYRLSLRSEWRKIKRKGQVFSAPLFNLIVDKKGNTEVREKASQFGFIVSTKISKKATVRNYLKRLLREVVRSFFPRIKPGFGVVILGKKSLIGKDFGEIKKETEKLFKKAKILS